MIGGSFVWDSRDDTKILNCMVNNENLDRLLPRQNALKQSKATYENMVLQIGGCGLKEEEAKTIDGIIADSKLVLGVRAASTVTIVKIPQGKTQKSRQGFVRECKRLITALGVELPTAVLNAMEQAAAA